VVSHHLGSFFRSRLPACCSRYQVWVRQVFPWVARPDLAACRSGSGVPTGAPPCEGLLLVGSRSASLRSAPLLPFVASTRLAAHRASLRPRLATGWGRAVRSSHTDLTFCVVRSLRDRDCDPSGRSRWCWGLGAPSAITSRVAPRCDAACVWNGFASGHPAAARGLPGRLATILHPLRSRPARCLSASRSATAPSPPTIAQKRCVNPERHLRAARSVGGSPPRHCFHQDAAPIASPPRPP
jgi:hypothetical protein